MLALDLATTAGFAFGSPGCTTPMFGHVDFRPGSDAVVFDRFERWLDSLITLLQPTHVYAEDVYPPKNVGVARRLYGFRGICAMTCHRRGVRHRTVGPNQVAAFFLGPARLRREEKKTATIAGCRLRGWHPENDDQADALALWARAENDLAPQPRSVGALFAA